MAAALVTASEERPAFMSEEELEANGRILFDFQPQRGEDDEEEDEDEEEEDEPQERPAKRQRQEIPESERMIEIPRSLFERADKINAAILKATGNEDCGFMMFITSSSYSMLKIFKKGIAASRKLLKEKKFQDSFCVAMAIFFTMQDYDVWYYDTDDIKGVESAFTTFHRLWTDIFKESDESIGLKGRHVLTEQLRQFGNSAREAHQYKFKWFM
ncbi:hypothetical protein LEN26_021003 [Aphanomyces euteiches]|nr:hypothetical protein LEN26_021003 [Aphanomyces euteiches]KAH9106419.1 hypothetical protein AeMF1_017965 [Aphanomyces euteiches]KAH9185149.1 hypothetical protein AeNC1_012879 [Aphanomyces euteiches]